MTHESNFAAISKPEGMEPETSRNFRAEVQRLRTEGSTIPPVGDNATVGPEAEAAGSEDAGVRAVRQCVQTALNWSTATHGE